MSFLLNKDIIIILAEPSSVHTLLRSWLKTLKKSSFFVTSEKYTYFCSTNTYVTFKLLIILIMHPASCVEKSKLNTTPYLASTITFRDVLPNVKNMILTNRP